MGYLVVTGADKKKGLYHLVAVDEQSLNVVGDYGMVNESMILQVKCTSDHYATLNFSIDRAGKIRQDSGDFNRFSPRGSAVVLAELQSKGGRTLGYRLLSCANNMCVNMRVEDIIQREAAMGDGEHFLQNGIIRNKTVNCYPMRPFNIRTIDTGSQAKKPQQSKQQSQQQSPQTKPPAAQTLPSIKQKPAVKAAQEMSTQQQREIEACRNAGISPRLLNDSRLSPQQMRVLWVSKSKGCLSESFADARLSVDAMKFYADRLYDKQTVADCKELLEHPELEVDQLSELYACVCQGVPYSDMIGLSATDVSVKREMAVSTYWGSSSDFDTDYLEKAANVARRLQSGQ